MKKLCIALILLLMLACVGHAEDWNGQTALYQNVIDEWVAGLSAGPETELTRESIENARICVWNGSGLDPLEAVGYTLLDMNGDGIPELIIGTAREFSPDDQLIFELLTLVDGQPVTLLEGWERNWLRLTLDTETNRFGYYYEGSNGASNSVWGHGLSGADMSQWEEAHALEVNYDLEGEQAVWTLDGAEIPETQADALIAGWQAGICPIWLTPFAMF